jgi:hypothetical protein
MMREVDQPAFSRPILVEDIFEPTTLVIEADADERVRLAKHVGVEAIGQLRADLELTREAGEGLHVKGELRATVRQICVVSLDPFDSEVVEPIDVHFAPVAATASAAPARRSAQQNRYQAERHDEPSLDWLSDVDPPDPIVDGRIDLGELCAEFLVLGLSPYPRKPGVEFSFGNSDAPGRDDSAFVVLRNLKKPHQ